MANAATALQYGGKPAQQLRQLGREAVATANRLRAAALKIGLGRAAKKGTLGFVEEFPENKNRRWSGVPDQMEILWCLVASGSMGNLQSLWIDGINIGDTGMTAFADAIKPNSKKPSGAMGALSTLSLDNNHIGEEGMASFADALANGSLGVLKVLYVKLNPGDLLPVKEACEARGITVVE